MLLFAHDTGIGTKPDAPSTSLQCTPLCSSASTLRHPPATPRPKFLINGANIRNQSNSRRITANFFSNRKYFAVFQHRPHHSAGITTHVRKATYPHSQER